MTKKITTYAEMLVEEERLQQLKIVQEQQIQTDVQAIKTELLPITNFASTAKKFFVRKSSEGLTFLSIKLLVDGFVKNVVLSKAGWVTRFIVPFFLKNYASNVAKEPGKFMDKIKHLFGKNGKVRQESKPS
jgi:hypothetical protein